MPQSFPGRQKYVAISNKVRERGNLSRSNTSWSDRQSKDAILAAKEQAKKDAIEFERMKESRRELPHLLNRAIVI